MIELALAVSLLFNGWLYYSGEKTEAALHNAERREMAAQSQLAACQSVSAAWESEANRTRAECEAARTIDRAACGKLIDINRAIDKGGVGESIDFNF